MFLLLLAPLGALSQESVKDLKQASGKGREVMRPEIHLPIPGPQMVEDTSRVYLRVERMPEFPGGAKAIQRYLAKNTRVPPAFRDAQMVGAVRVAFVVGEKGEILETRVKRGLGYGCDEEALRVVGAMPRWKPGSQDGRPVKVWREVDVRFDQPQ
ncbi:MAG: energy transducer TonB [Flavobacteriales bacterium]|nr:energy transducer TonB [Flavobacteriales bacterium]